MSTAKELNDKIILYMKKNIEFTIKDLMVYTGKEKKQIRIDIATIRHRNSKDYKIISKKGLDGEVIYEFKHEYNKKNHEDILRKVFC